MNTLLILHFVVNSAILYFYMRLKDGEFSFREHYKETLITFFFGWIVAVYLTIK